MRGHRSARRVALEDQALALLIEVGKSGGAKGRLSTAEVAVGIGLSRYDGTAWRILRGLELEGRVTCHRDSAMRAVFWSAKA